MRSRAGVALLAITTLGAAARAVAAAAHSAHISADQRAYSLLALGLSDHGRYGAHGLSGPFHWPPGAPVLFALANPSDPARVDVPRPRVPAAYVAQVAVGTLTIPAAAWVARAAAGTAAGLVAAT